MTRGRYKPAFDWSPQRLAIIEQAMREGDTSKPYRLARSIIQQEGWGTDPKNVASKIYAFLRADPRTQTRVTWKDLYEDLYRENHTGSSDMDWQTDANRRRIALM